jgi:hypothetical protein
MTPSELKLRAVPLLVEGLADAEIAARLGLHSATIATWRAYDAALMQIVRRLRHSDAGQPTDPTADPPPRVTTRMASFS